MAHPINPPADTYYLLRRQIADAVYHSDGLVESHGFWYWEPEREAKAPTDWLVGPYIKKRLAIKQRTKYINKFGDGPAIRIWWM